MSSDADVDARFAGLRIPLFENALRLARHQDVKLILDIKTAGIGAAVLEVLQREGMMKRMYFNGEWEDIKKINPSATSVGDGTVWVQPGISAGQVEAYHRQAKAVVANFSANDHAMDLHSMNAAVAAGVDGINVDYPRLGADAVGRPVEVKLNALAIMASDGESSARANAILELSKYRGFSLGDKFTNWLLD